MTTSRVASDLAAIMVPIGVVGAVLAVLCAVIAGVAIMRGAGGLTGGAVGVWIPAALISSVAGFGSQWLPLIVSGAALVAMLVIGGVVRGIITAAGAERPQTEKVEAVVLSTPVAADAVSATSAEAAPAGVGGVGGVAAGAVAAVSAAVPTLTRPNPVRAA